jgi:hypothetical protein
VKGGLRARLKETQERETERRQALVRIGEERFKRRLSDLNDHYELAMRRLDKISGLNEEHYQKKAELVKEMVAGRRFRGSPPTGTLSQAVKTGRKFAEVSAKAKPKRRKRPR